MIKHCINEVFYYPPKSGFCDWFEMENWIFLICNSIHGFLQNFFVLACGQSITCKIVTACFYIPFWDLARWEGVGNSGFPKRQICKWSKHNDTACLDMALQTLK